MSEIIPQSSIDKSSLTTADQPNVTQSNTALLDQPSIRHFEGGRDKSSRTTIIAIIIASVFTLIYALTRTTYYSVDAVKIAQGIVTFHHTHDLNALFPPGYLLYSALGLATLRLSELFGFHGDPLHVLQAVNCVCGGIGLGVLSILLRQILTRSRSLTILVPVALGFSFGYWSLATDGRAQMIALALTLIGCCLLVRAMLVPSWQRCAGAGLIFSAAALFHILTVIFLPAGIVAIWLGAYTQGDPRLEFKARWMNIATFLASVALPVLIVYLWIAVGLIGLHSIHGILAWIRMGFDSDWWINPHTMADLRLDSYSLRKALFVEPGGKSGTFHLASEIGSAPAALYWLSLAVWFVAVYYIASNTAFMMRSHYRPYLCVALTAIASYAVAFTYICPGEFIYWTPVVVASSVVTAICASYYRGRRRGSLWLVGIGCWTAIFGLSNFLLFISPHRLESNNPWMTEAQSLASHSKSGDLIVVSGFDEDEPIVVYAPYFVHRQIFSLRNSLEAHNGDVVLTSRDLNGAVAASVQSGHHVYAYGDIWSDPDTRARLSNVAREYNPQQVFAGLQRAQGWKDPTDNDGYIWKLIPNLPLGRKDFRE